MFDTSQFRMVSIGYVAENKLRSTDAVEVSLTELRPMINGELVAGIQEDSVDCVDSFGNALTFKVKTSNTISAKWLGDGTNRVSSPDVRRGEQVHLYQFGDTDMYYWKAVSMPGVNTRKLETVIHAFSNTTDENDNKLTAKNAWSEEISTQDGHWTRQTNKSNGEPFAYTQQINAKDGSVVIIADDAGAHQSLDSKEDKHILETSSGGSLILEKRTLRVNVDIIELIAAKEAIITTPIGTFNIDSGTWKGNLTFIGNMVGSASGTYTFNGNVITNANLTNKGKNVGGDHQHLFVKSGGDTSGPPA